MCNCGHGQDRHYVDYAYGIGCWWGRCLEPHCVCGKFVDVWGPLIRN